MNSVFYPQQKEEINRHVCQGKERRIFEEGDFGLVSELGKFCINFAPLGDENPTMVSIFSAKLSNFQAFFSMEVKCSNFVTDECNFF